MTDEAEGRDALWRVLEDRTSPVEARGEAARALHTVPDQRTRLTEKIRGIIQEPGGSPWAEQVNTVTSLAPLLPGDDARRELAALAHDRRACPDDHVTVADAMYPNDETGAVGLLLQVLSDPAAGDVRRAAAARLLVERVPARKAANVPWDTKIAPVLRGIARDTFAPSAARVEAAATLACLRLPGCEDEALHLLRGMAIPSEPHTLDGWHPEHIRLFGEDITADGSWDDTGWTAVQKLKELERWETDTSHDVRLFLERVAHDDRQPADARIRAAEWFTQYGLRDEGLEVLRRLARDTTQDLGRRIDAALGLYRFSSHDDETAAMIEPLVHDKTVPGRARLDMIIWLALLRTTQDAEDAEETEAPLLLSQMAHDPNAPMLLRIWSVLRLSLAWPPEARHLDRVRRVARDSRLPGEVRSAAMYLLASWHDRDVPAMAAALAADTEANGDARVLAAFVLAASGGTGEQERPVRVFGDVLRAGDATALGRLEAASALDALGAWEDEFLDAFREPLADQDLDNEWRGEFARLASRLAPHGDGASLLGAVAADPALDVPGVLTIATVLGASTPGSVVARLVAEATAEATAAQYDADPDGEDQVRDPRGAVDVLKQPAFRIAAAEQLRDQAGDTSGDIPSRRRALAALAAIGYGDEAAGMLKDLLDQVGRCETDERIEIIAMIGQLDDRRHAIAELTHETGRADRTAGNLLACARALQALDLPQFAGPMFERAAQAAPSGTNADIATSCRAVGGLWSLGPRGMAEARDLACQTASRYDVSVADRLKIADLLAHVGLVAQARTQARLAAYNPDATPAQRRRSAVRLFRSGAGYWEPAGILRGLADEDDVPDAERKKARTALARLRR